ncbi:MAG: carbamate kinase [Peptoniphilaceae bacterium]|nr:carbamate kinase [Peptoniphilaceae bacterium]MDY6019480.1 carbamate kinase [Anaerococcus sp.]
MKRQRIVIALGGNALGSTPEEQLELVKKTAKTIVDLSENYDIAIGHGNGPQVGMINNALEFSANKGGKTPEMPFPECGAMSQGYIGYHLSQSIRNELRNRNIEKEVAYIVTQVVVDEDDKAFQKPSKPIGSFMTKEEADAKHAENGYEYVEDAGRGYRRVVASPIPKNIVEIKIVEDLVKNSNIVITVGGGGVPVIETSQGLKGVPAVIDKDRSSALLAEELHADKLVILTAVDQVMINFNKPNQESISEMNLDQAKQYIEEGHFAPGSMLPKVEACMEFVEKSENGEALITSLERAAEALEGKTGTVIKK